MTPQRIVVVGGGQAGGWAVKTLRDSGYAGALTLVTDEVHPPYERPPLSKALLAGKVAPESTYLFKDELFTGLALDWRRGRRAVALDPQRRALQLDDGVWLDFDRLLLATGGSARQLPTVGVPVHTLRSLDDAQALHARLRAGNRLLVIGGGWVGLEVASTARAAGLAVHVVESAPRLCQRVLPPELGHTLLRLHLRHGVTFSLGASITRLAAGADGCVHAELASGEHFEVDHVVAGIGMIVNDGLARRAGLACANGILVDARCATSDAAIFAAGDVAVTRTRWLADPLRLESWQNAQDQGIAAAKAMLGLDVHYDPVPRFWSDQHGMNLQIFGLPQPDDAIVWRGNPEQGPAMAFALRGEILRAVVAFNAGRDLRQARTLVERHARIDPIKLADAAVDLRTAERLP